MNLGIVGTGAMGRVLYQYALEEGSFEQCFLIEPRERQPWPEERLDLLIDFSHPGAIYKIYEYVRERGGGIPVVLATTGYGPEEETMIELLRKICPLDRSSNYSRGVTAMARLCELGAELLGETADIRIAEAHHTQKKDAPSGTALMLAAAAGVRTNSGHASGATNGITSGVANSGVDAGGSAGGIAGSAGGIAGSAAGGDAGSASADCDETVNGALPEIVSLRMGTVFGEHSVYFALEDEILEVKHTALSKRIFAIGALEAGKRLLSTLRPENVCCQP